LIQQVWAEQSEKLFTEQEMQRKLVNVKAMLEQLDEAQGDNMADRRKRIKIITELSQFVELIARDAKEEVFGSDDFETIWVELNTTPDHRTRVINWLEAKITDGMVNGFGGVAQRLQAWRVQNTYMTSKSAAMKRYINKRESRPCLIEEEKIYQHFREK
jgi:hypothetical protein